MSRRGKATAKHKLTAALGGALTWLGNRELPTLLAIFLAAGGLWAFAELADEVIEGETQTIDRAILLALRSSEDVSDPLGPRWVEEIGRDITALGGVAVLTAITLATIGYLLLQRDRWTASFVLAAVVGGLLMSLLLKALFERPRPDLVPHGAEVYTASFPSGHAMMSAATYFTLGALLARLHTQRRLKAYFMLVALIIVVAVGVSRVYLGVHWPTDVAAGWSVGATWAIVCWLTAFYLQRRGGMAAGEAHHESESPGEPAIPGD